MSSPALKLLEDRRKMAEALRGIVRDMEATYDACKGKGSRVEISIGQFRRLNAARALLRELGEAPL